MSKTLLSAGFVLLLILPADGILNNVQAMDVIDGHPAAVENCNLPGNFHEGSDGRTIDIIGDATYSSSGTGRAKGNSFQIDLDVTLIEAEFWLDFSDTQALTYYVFVCPEEFGTYNEVYRNSEVVIGSGEGWYSSGTVSINMDTGNHYIIAVSWDGLMTYYYASGDSQVTSFGYQTHGYASGYDPLPSSFESLSNDQAIYHQRLDTIPNTALERFTWGAIKSTF